MAGVKRGGASSQGKNAATKFEEKIEVSGHLHLEQLGDELADKQTRVSWIMEDTGMSKDDAQYVADMMVDWSGGDLYMKIRDDQARGLETDDVVMIEGYISKAPKYTGTISRGISFDNTEDAKSIISALESGKRITMNGTSSWTSDGRVAREFSSQQNIGILFVSDHPKAATSIQHLSKWG